MIADSRIKALRGESAHIDPILISEGLELKSVGLLVSNSPHTIWEIIYHMNYWQDFIINILEGGNPKSPEHSEETWPSQKKPPGKQEWLEMVLRFKEGMKRAEDECRNDLSEHLQGNVGNTRFHMLMDLIMHNSYHSAQVVFIRRQLGEWPPPSGGDS
ncbi:DinB family protein [Halobacillus shinanisalinarum]|uniref:DinB family protein n=1 Tax=Halobacillus shinanisalinarum TaxID=2932258 RepID=A0ABY4GZ11_9BACI|nr:DinB family protein [Halobacillus shinanisalinarum]UOQ93119.1 DinB family protein [Halobacillus shinanisalinarum]